MRSSEYYFIVLLSFAWIYNQGQCGKMLDTPPTIWLDRNWQIQDTEPVGNKITQVRGTDNERTSLTYDLEAIPIGSKIPLPFRIDRNSGAVYLNESLKGRAGQNIRLYVKAQNGELVAKTEVYVNIIDSSASFKPPTSPNHSSFPISHGSFYNFANFHNRGLPQPPVIPNDVPINIANNSPSPVPKQPYFQQKTYPEFPTNKKNATTLLRPLLPQNNINSEHDNPNTQRNITSETKMPIDNNITNTNSLDEAVQSPPEISNTLVPTISVCAVFLTVGIIAAAFRKKIYLRKSKDSKKDMAKESSGGIVLQEEPSLALQHWRGPSAFGNRYESWKTESNNQDGSPITATVKNVDRWEFPRHRLKFFNVLGEGAFGQVWKCEALGLDGGKDSGVSIVAVKTLKENANEKERSDLISELQVMKMLEPHSNVVRLLGCCSEKEPIFLIMEYVTKGKLQSYLRNSRAERYYNNMHGQSKSLTSRDLTSFAYQVAKGMEFLSANGIIHRDLAARNILITDEHICKVADFGFARDVIASHVYERKSEGRLPIRWMAPESLYDNIFSVKSDVWSFGVLIWEVVTLGSTPYPGLSAADVMRKVRDGYRLDKPEHCRRELYNIMYYCWDKDPKERPSFTECLEFLEKLIMTETDYIELERFPDHSYYNMMSLSGEKL